MGEQRQSAIRVLLVGATGLVGGHCLSQLLADEDIGQVTIFARHPLEQTHPKLTVHLVDFDQLRDHAGAIDADAVLCCLGTTHRAAGSPEALLDYLIANPYGELVQVRDLVTLQYGQGMTQVDHLERNRNIRLQVTPPEEMPLQTAMELISDDLVPTLEREGKLDQVRVSVGGNADKLTETRIALQWNLALAVIIIYLLMSALFSNYLYPAIILFSVPLAAAGGFIGLMLVNMFIAPQPFDILVMLGFIILVGTVVNNAILIVHQSLNNVRYEGMTGIAAIRHSVRTRIRPIFMSTTTSLFGLLLKKRRIRQTF